MKRIGIFLLILFGQRLVASLIPTPFIVEPETIQRIGYSHTTRLLDERLIGDAFGIAMAKLRDTTNSSIIVISDEFWHRLLYFRFNDSTINNKSEVKEIKEFGQFGSSSGEFFKPKGLCIDNTIYSGNPLEYSIYVADYWNSRVVKLKYI